MEVYCVIILLRGGKRDFMIDEDFFRISAWYDKEYERIKKEAQDRGEWVMIGFDSNQHLFKELRKELEEKLREHRTRREKENSQ